MGRPGEEYRPADQLPDKAKFITAVHGPGLFVVAHDSRTFFSKTDGFNLHGAYTQQHKVFFGCQGAAFAKGEVVFNRAAFVAVTFNKYAQIGFAFQYFGFTAQNLLSLRVDCRAVKRKIDLFLLR